MIDEQLIDPPDCDVCPAPRAWSDVLVSELPSVDVTIARSLAAIGITHAHQRRLVLLLVNEVARRLYVEGVARQRAERIVELEALVRSLRGSDGPVHGPSLPPIFTCPRCGKETMLIHSGDRVCMVRLNEHGVPCGGRIPEGEWGDDFI